MSKEKNKTGTVVLINLAVLLCLTIVSSTMSGGIALAFFVSLLQAFICGLVGVIIVLGKSTRADIGQGFLLSCMVLLLPGFFLCLGL